MRPARRTARDSSRERVIEPSRLESTRPRAHRARAGVARLAVAALASSLVVGACSPRRLVERAALSGIGRATGIAYGAGERRRLDVYWPPLSRARAPVIVFIYGGRWQSGARRDYLLLARALVERGWVVVVPDYRLYPDTIFPAWVEDGARAVRWTVDHASSLGGDTARVFVIGHSAGAHTATLLALDERYLRDAGVRAGAVRGFVSLAGPVDTTWTDPDVQALMGPRAGWPATFPREFIDGTEAPLLLLHGGADRTVSPVNSERLAERIRARGGCARSKVYPRVGHVQLALALAFPALVHGPVQRDVARFIADPVGDACPARRAATPVASP